MSTKHHFKAGKSSNNNKRYSASVDESTTMKDENSVERLSGGTELLKTSLSTHSVALKFGPDDSGRSDSYSSKSPETLGKEKEKTSHRKGNRLRSNSFLKGSSSNQNNSNLAHNYNNNAAATSTTSLVDHNNSHSIMIKKKKVVKRGRSYSQSGILDRPEFNAKDKDKSGLFGKKKADRRGRSRMSSVSLEMLNFKGHSSLDVNHHTRFAVFGAGGVGKSSIVGQFVSNTFSSEYSPTIEDNFWKVVNVDGVAQTLEIIDTAGQSEYLSLRNQFIKTGEAFLMVYAINDMRSFLELKTIVKSILLIRKKVPMLICGNKFDLTTDRQVTQKEASHFAEENNASFIEVSAKLNKEIDSCFHELVRRWRYQTLVVEKQQQQQQQKHYFQYHTSDFKSHSHSDTSLSRHMTSDDGGGSVSPLPMRSRSNRNSFCITESSKLQNTLVQEMSGGNHDNNNNNNNNQPVKHKTFTYSRSRSNSNVHKTRSDNSFDNILQAMATNNNNNNNNNNTVDHNKTSTTSTSTTTNNNNNCSLSQIPDSKNGSISPSKSKKQNRNSSFEPGSNDNGNSDKNNNNNNNSDNNNDEGEPNSRSSLEGSGRRARRPSFWRKMGLSGSSERIKGYVSSAVS